jgi:multidrug efflux pump subunit AcrB/ABC-type multidrug transport system ATPase subunit
MFFGGVVLLGLAALQLIPVELLPPFSGQSLYVNFARPGSDPEVVEREILQPLEARVSELAGLEETWGQIQGPAGSLQLRFAPGTNLKVRGLELRRIAAEIARAQPMGTTVDASTSDPAEFLRGFAMFVQVLGAADRNALRDVIEEHVEPRLTAVAGVSRVVVFGGASREMTVWLDPDRCAALDVTPDQVTSALARAVRRLEFLGGLEDEAGRTSVVMDGRPRGPVSVEETRIRPDSPVLLRHVAEVEVGTGREEMIFRVNGKPSVGLIVYQEEGANLVRLGRALRDRLDLLREEFAPYGLDFIISFDGAEMIEDQLGRLRKLALSGFLIALAVLFLFLRQWRGVAVVGVAVPVSLLAALALLFLGGQSINLITLFGLAVGIGMLVDNSIVVYEAVQRQLERGSDPDDAASEGIRRTVRAIFAASITNGIVFLPILFLPSEFAGVRPILEVVALAYLLPIAASLVIAVGLVPLLARRLAAPAAVARLAKLRRRRDSLAGLRPPDRARGIFAGVLTAALRRPAAWIGTVTVAVLITAVTALSWVTYSALTQEASEADQVQLSIELPSGGSLEQATAVFASLEEAAQSLEGVKTVESFVREEGGSFTVTLLDEEERPDEISAARVRQVVRHEAIRIGEDVVVRTPEEAGGGSGSGRSTGAERALGQGPSEVVVSGPESARLKRLAADIDQRLSSIPEIAWSDVSTRTGQQEIHVIPEAAALRAFGLTPDQVLPVLGVLRREGVAMRIGFTLPDGREIPLTVRKTESRYRSNEQIGRLRVSTASGVLPLEALADVRRMPPPSVISHHNGRREMSVFYSYSSNAPASGPAREDLEKRISEGIQEIHRPPGYTIETPPPDEGLAWFKKIVVPVLLLLFAVLAITFESLTLPLLVLLALPLTVLGATWALVLSGMPAGMMGVVGALSLIGLTVNPGILLVDRMQQNARVGGMSAGAAALAAVRERARPVLMTTTTTVAGLWPLALVTGRANELWPPFATVVMGGLVTSTLLTLLVIPVGFVFLRRLDTIFGRLGPWVLIGWVGATAAVMTPLIRSEQITSMLWQTLTTLLVAGAFLGVAVLAFRRPRIPDPAAAEGPPAVEVRSLCKIYGRPGPIGRAWRAPDRFARWVLDRGGKPFDSRDALERLLPLVVLAGGASYLAFSVQTLFWRLVFLFVAAGLVARLLREVRRARGKVDDLGRVLPGGAEGVLAALMPWLAVGYVAGAWYALPKLSGELPEVRLWIPIAIAVVTAIAQFGRRTALRIARGTIGEKARGRLPRLRTMWRRFARRVFGLDLPRDVVTALSGVNFRAESGMVGILGPNGAGKTTLLRQLAGILEPTLGTMEIGGVPLRRIRRYLGRWVGYLPQEFGLPNDLTAREYLEYYALLYDIRPAPERRERIDGLLREVGLGEKSDQKIGSYSGGMRQRVAVARTLLRLPEVIIVDEPTVGLDPRERIRFRNLLSRLAEGRVVLFSTHVVEDVAVACERVIVLARGRLVFDGAPPDLALQARGRVWEVHLPDGGEESLPDGSMVVDQVPGEGGLWRLRVLSGSRPHEDATPTEPTLEDGYLVLVGEEATA